MNVQNLKFELDEWFLNRKRIQKIINDISKNFDFRIKEALSFLKAHEVLVIPTTVCTFISEECKLFFSHDNKEEPSEKTIFGKMELFIKIYKGCGEKATRRKPWNCDGEIEIFFYWCDRTETLAKGVIKK